LAPYVLGWRLVTTSCRQRRARGRSSARRAPGYRARRRSRLLREPLLADRDDEGADLEEDHVDVLAAVARDADHRAHVSVLGAPAAPGVLAAGALGVGVRPDEAVGRVDRRVDVARVGDAPALADRGTGPLTDHADLGRHLDRAG